jgi:hypothetical protein
MIALNLTNDFGAVDGLESISVVTRGEQTIEVDGLLRDVSTKEIVSSNGFCQSGDVFVHAPSASLAAVNVGDMVVAGDVEYTILDIRKEHITGKLRMLCRNLVIAESLDTVVSIQRATFANGSTGADNATWSTIHTDLRGRLQIDESNREVKHGQRTLIEKGSVYIRETLDLLANDRVLMPGGAIYRVTGTNSPNSLGKLFEINVETW